MIDQVIVLSISHLVYRSLNSSLSLEGQDTYEDDETGQTACLKRGRSLFKSSMGPRYEPYVKQDFYKPAADYRRLPLLIV